MPKQLSMQILLDVIQALEIDVPIMRFEQNDNGTVTIYLYGGEVKHWPPAATVGVDLRVNPDPNPANPMPDYPKPPVTRTALQKSQRAKKSQTKST
jgi:hypothetical protein